MLVSQVVTQRDAHLLNTREMSAAFREAYPAGQAAAAHRRRPALRRDDGRRARRRPGLRPRHDARRGRVASSSTGSRRPREEQPHDRRGRHHRRAPPLRAVLRTPTTPATSSTAPTRALFGDVATEMCIRTDGDEGLFASYSDVQFRAPVRAGDVLEITCELTRVGTRSRGLGLRRARRRARRSDAGAAGCRRRCSTGRSSPPPRPAPSSSRRRRARRGVSPRHAVRPRIFVKSV